jgi:hypothetical protein
MNQVFRMVRVCAVLSLCVTVIACKQNINLPGVSVMAKTVATSSDALLSLPQDFYDSCVREVTWSRGSILTSPAATKGLKAALPPDKITRFVKTLKTLPPFSRAVDALDVPTYCAPNKATSEQMIAVTSVLTAYFAALGKLADTGTTTGLGIDKLASFEF